MKSWVKMNSWTSEDTKAVKTWFDLDKYREFESISINMLYHEIWARTYFFQTSNRRRNAENSIEKLYADIGW